MLVRAALVPSLLLLTAHSFALIAVRHARLVVVRASDLDEGDALLAEAVGAQLEEPEPPELAAIHDSWDALLANHLRPAGAPVGNVKFAAVSYVELAAEEGFAALVESISKVDAATVKAWPPNAQCAFYINAYNILCAEHVCRTIRAGGCLCGNQVQAPCG